MASRNQIKAAREIAQFVVENGRVQGEGSERLESLRIEVEFECNERDLDDCAEIAEVAVNLAA
jgi:hypothetical protein